MSDQVPCRKIVVSVLPAVLSPSVQDAIAVLLAESLDFYASDRISADKISEVLKVFDLPAKSVKTTEESPRSSAPA